MSLSTAEPAVKHSIFIEQISRKPNLYPWTHDFIQAMRHGFWTDAEFSFKSDIQHFKVNLNDREREMIVRTLSAIGQIEVAVKTFWAKLGDNLPHPSLCDLGYVMADIEVIHNHAYERLLKVLDLEDVFEENLKLDFIQGRVKYLRKYTHRFYKDSRKQYLYAIILFTLFVENVSLFSQFYVINWFGRFRNVLKDTNQQVSYTRNEECYSSDTEVLTPRGWKLIKDMVVGDDVIQYCEGGTLEIVQVLHTVANDFAGDLINFTRKGNDCLVTPGHDMVYYDVTGQYRRRKAGEMKLHKEVFLPKAGKLSQQGVDELSFEHRLRIAIQADGTNLHWTNKAGEQLLRGKDGGYTHSLKLTKLRKIERLRWILQNLDIEFSEEPSEETEVNFKLRYNHDHDYKEMTWVDIREKSQAWCDAFIKETVEWDGYAEYNHTGYSSTNKECIDIVQLVAILAGYSTNIYKRVDPRKKSYKSCYKLSFMESPTPPCSHGIKKNSVSYDGKVYCVTVPSGAIMTRRNDQTFIAGNCIHALVGIKLINTIKEEHPELFDEELVERIRHEAAEAFKAESKIIDWMVNGTDEKGLSAAILKELIKKRINDSLEQIGIEPIFEIDPVIIKETMWFEEELHGNNMVDFFHARPTDYSKKSQVFDADSLFD